MTHTRDVAAMTGKVNSKDRIGLADRSRFEHLLAYLMSGQLTANGECNHGGFDSSLAGRVSEPRVHADLSRLCTEIKMQG